LQFGSGLNQTDLLTLKGKAINLLTYLVKAFVFNVASPWLSSRPWKAMRNEAGLKPYRSYKGGCEPKLTMHVAATLAIDPPQPLAAGGL
jgi:hypothetical protein